MVERLTEQQISEFKEAFTLFDKDGDGLISVKQLGTVMKSLGQNPTEAELQEMIQEIESNGQNNINFTQFCDLIANKVQEIETEEEYIQAFEVLDKDGEGNIAFDDLRHLLIMLGDKLTIEEFNQMMSGIEINNGKINYRELVKIMISK